MKLLTRVRPPAWAIIAANAAFLLWALVTAAAADRCAVRPATLSACDLERAVGAGLATVAIGVLWLLVNAVLSAVWFGSMRSDVAASSLPQ